MIRDKKCIGVLTSGGDAPGMNAAIRAVVRTAITKDIIPVGVIRGYNGLLEKNITRMDARSVSGIIQRGGTILKTARCKEFYEEKYRDNPEITKKLITEYYDNYLSMKKNKFLFAEAYYQPYRFKISEDLYDYVINESDRCGFYKTGSQDSHGYTIFHNNDVKK